MALHIPVDSFVTVDSHMDESEVNKEDVKQAAVDCFDRAEDVRKKRKLDQTICDALNTMVNNKIVVEPLCEKNPDRFVIFPIKNHDVWKMYEDASAAMWFAHEVKLEQDILDWELLNKDEKFFFTHVLAFFAASDGIVMENLAARFLNEIQMPEARAFYALQIHMEQIHSETYSMLIDTYVRDPKEKDRLFKAIHNFPAIKEKADWAIKWIESETSTFAERLVAFAIVEGVFFSGSFCSIFWVKRRGILPGLTFSNELISRDENMHTSHATLLYNTRIKNKLTDIRIHTMMKEAVDIEARFVTEALPVRLIGMNAVNMVTYIKHVADFLLTSMGHPVIWDVKDPFDFTQQQSIRGQTNFFEKEVGDYRRATTTNQPFDVNAEF